MFSLAKQSKKCTCYLWNKYAKLLVIKDNFTILILTGGVSASTGANGAIVSIGKNQLMPGMKY